MAEQSRLMATTPSSVEGRMDMTYTTLNSREQAVRDESQSALFEPVVILPSQLAVDAHWGSATAGPIALMIAVLEDAARCIERGRQRRHARTRKLAAEAESWVRCDSREWPFAFASICDVLGLDVSATRARFLADGVSLGDGKRTPDWNVPRGRGRTLVCPDRPTSRAA